MRFNLTIENDEGQVIFEASKPSVELLEEELDRFERHGKQIEGQAAEEN